jgi:hypothetical protein
VSLEVATTLFNQLPNEVRKRSRRSTEGRAIIISLLSSCPILPSPERGINAERGTKKRRGERGEERKEEAERD